MENYCFVDPSAKISCSLVKIWNSWPITYRSLSLLNALHLNRGPRICHFLEIQITSRDSYHKNVYKTYRLYTSFCFLLFAVNAPLVSSHTLHSSRFLTGRLVWFKKIYHRNDMIFYVISEGHSYHIDPMLSFFLSNILNHFEEKVESFTSMYKKVFVQFWLFYKSFSTHPTMITVISCVASQISN